MDFRTVFRHRQPLLFAPSLLGLLAALVSLFVEGSVLATCLLLSVAAASFLGTRWFVVQLRQADRQRSLLDAQLIQSQKLASIGELSAGIGHEINNPLAIIAREVEWVRHLLTAPEVGSAKNRTEMEESLREIAHQVDRCREITQNLLNFARKVEPVLQDVNVNKLIDDMARLVEKEAAQDKIVVRRDFEADLPTIVSDPPCLRQVVLNLLNNARQAVEREGTITIGTRAAADRSIEIFVTDTGCGIPREHLSKIFDPFFTTKPQGKGTGLGLSICHGIIDRLGGRIAVASEVGKGTTFTVYLPGKAKGDTR